MRVFTFGPLRRRVAGAARVGGAYQRLTLARRFLIVSLVVVLTGMLAIGAWVSRQIEDGVLRHATAVTGLYVQSIISDHLQSLATASQLSEADLAALDRVLAETSLGEDVVAFKVWSMDGEVIYSPNRALIGRRFPAIKDELAGALSGKVTADLSDLTAPENEYERQRWRHLLEVYVPVRQQGHGRIIAVTEFYQRPDTLEADLTAARTRSWAVVAGVMLVLYALLTGTVKRGSDTISHQQAALRQQVAELSRLLDQNARLRDRVQQAAGRTTALNEQALRRISADLHDGPGQALSLALLRLDSLQEASPHDGVANGDFAVVQGAVHDALAEVRAISAGLRLPELAPLSVAEVVERAAHDHERRSGSRVQLELQDVPARAPLPIKIALFRSLQESLSNAVRHGGGAATARVTTTDGMLILRVSDRGPGFAPERVSGEGHLGLAGMRERAELLGGSFTVDSRPGQGTTVEVRWPLFEMHGRD